MSTAHTAAINAHFDWSSLTVTSDIPAESPAVLAALADAARYAEMAAVARELAEVRNDGDTMRATARTLDTLARRAEERAAWLRGRTRTDDGRWRYDHAAEAPADTRETRGAALAASGAVRALSATWFEVTGSTGNVYLVILEAGRLTCTCPDYVERLSRATAADGAPRICKHGEAVRAAGHALPVEPPATPEPAPSVAEVAPAPIAYGSVYLARIAGRDVAVRVTGPNPRTPKGRGFWATNLETGRTVTIASPGCLRPAEVATAAA